MAKEVFIPKLGQTMEEATLVHWLVDDGAQIAQGDAILEVETDKALFTVEANATGHLHIGPFKEGDVVPVLTVVATIGKPEESFVSAGRVIEAVAGAAAEMTASDSQRLAAAESTQTRAQAGRVFASPRARKLAAAEGVDLSKVTPTAGKGQRVDEGDILAYLSQMPQATPVAQRMAIVAGINLRGVHGTGPGGRITKEDVQRAQVPATRPPVAIPPAALPEAEVMERVPLTGVRGIIADRMARSAQTTARVTLLMEADATEFVAMRERLKARVAEEWGFAPGHNDLLAKTVATALRQFPYMNSRLADEAIECLAHINLGMATDTERGLLVPVIRDADKKSLRQFGTEFRELVERARDGKSLPDDLTDGTFTITNLGMYDVMAFSPLIRLPEAAILGVGCITPRPVAHNQQIEIRQMLMLSLVFDHRLVDGAPAARFLQYIKDLIEEPYLWLAAKT
jgi:pyruvate dehydrogenase E2 component (dihydrolipoamide acetyltransferase)